MQRYASPEAALGALVAAQNRIASGELAPVLGKAPTPEQLKEFREARGIPETADKYDLGKDIKIEDSEKGLMSKLFEAAHGSNQTPEQVKSVVKAWRDIQAEAAQALQTKDEEGRDRIADELRTEWGPEFKRNVNLINGLLDGAGSQSLKNVILDARLPDGTKFGNSKEVMKLLVGLALVQNPTGVVVPGAGGDPSAGIREEIAKIQKVRSENRKAYDKDSAMQTRERELINAAIKMNLMDDRGNWKKAA